MLVSSKLKVLAKVVGIPLGTIVGIAVAITALGAYDLSHTHRHVDLVGASESTESSSIPTSQPSVSSDTSTSSTDNTAPSTTVSPSQSNTYSPPQLPKVQVDPTVAWFNDHSSIFDKLSLYAQQIDSAIGGCGTINPDYNSMCVDYDGSSVLPVCTSLQDEVNTGKSYGPIAYAPANTPWQNALSLFSSAAQTCISKINAHQYVGSSTDVGYTIKPALLQGVQDLTAATSADTDYERTL